MLTSHTTHPLDPIIAAEIRAATTVLREQASPTQLRFKVVDLFENPKSSVLSWISKSTSSIDRRARIYYHIFGSSHLWKAIVNITHRAVESQEELPGTKGPVDYVEFERVHDACNSHPAVLAEITKLKLPMGAKVINDPWAYGTDDAKERRRLFQCYMYIVLNDDPEANHYSLPAPFAPVFDAHTLELCWIDQLPLSTSAQVGETQPWNVVEPVEYAASILGEDYFRKDLKALQISQPEGPSFTMRGRHISWQK